MTATAVLVTGGREYHNVTKIREVLAKYPPGTVIIHGDAAGADALCKSIATEEFSFPVITVPYFKHLGKAGGPARNTLMLKVLLGLASQGYEIHVEAFHSDISKSKGTKNMCQQAHKAGLEVPVHK